MKIKIKQILLLSILSIFLIACTNTNQSNSLTLRKASVLSEKDIYLPKRRISK